MQSTRPQVSSPSCPPSSSPRKKLLSGALSRRQKLVEVLELFTLISLGVLFFLYREYPVITSQEVGLLTGEASDMERKAEYQGICFIYLSERKLIQMGNKVH